MRPGHLTVERELGRIAGRNHGVVTRAESLGAGLSVKEIRHRLGTGALLRVHPGVYRVGHRAPSLEAHYLAAVRACGRGASLGGAAAGHLIGLLGGAAAEPEVITPTERRIPGIRTVRSRRIDPRDVMCVRGIPCTTVARTLVDLAAALAVDDLARVCHEAGVRHGTTPREVESVLDRLPTSPGAAKLRVILRGDAPVTLSRLEAGFLERMREAGLPLPETNRRAGGRRVDCRWPARRLTVELDGYRYHSSRHAWEQDRRREREARARGDEFRRYTYGDVFEQPRLMLAELRPLLQGVDRPALVPQEGTWTGHFWRLDGPAACSVLPWCPRRALRQDGRNPGHALGPKPGARRRHPSGRDRTLVEWPRASSPACSTEDVPGRDA